MSRLAPAGTVRPAIWRAGCQEPARAVLGTTGAGRLARQYLFGQERLRASILATAAETGGRFHLVDGELPAGAETGFDIDRFMKVTVELGEVVLGPPGTRPADVRPEDRPSAG